MALGWVIAYPYTSRPPPARTSLRSGSGSAALRTVIGGLFRARPGTTAAGVMRDINGWTDFFFLLESGKTHSVNHLMGV